MIKSIDETIPALYTNRALCFKNMNLWKEAQEDCIQALRLDPKNFKAKFLEAESHLRMALLNNDDSKVTELDQAIKLLEIGREILTIVLEFDNIVNEGRNEKDILPVLYEGKKSLEIASQTQDIRAIERAKEFAEDQLSAGLFQELMSLIDSSSIEAADVKKYTSEFPPEYLCCPISLVVS